MIRTVVRDRNTQIKEDIQARKAQLVKDTLDLVPVKRIIAEYKDIEKRQNAIADKLKPFGIYPDGTAAHDFESRFLKDKPAFVDEDRYIARLLKADSKEAANILNELGIKL